MSYNKTIYLIFIFCSCHIIGDQKINNDYLPDLKIKNVKSRNITPKISKPSPGKPVSTTRGLMGIEFYILIENVGSGDWDNNLCLSYIFQENGRQTENSIMFEDLMIPYASSQEVTFTVKNIIQKPKSVTFILNPSNVDSSRCNAFSEELFYNNNIYKHYLSK
jgi:hypothetical protein